MCSLNVKSFEEVFRVNQNWEKIKEVAGKNNDLITTGQIEEFEFSRLMIKNR